MKYFYYILILILIVIIYNGIYKNEDYYIYKNEYTQLATYLNNLDEENEENKKKRKILFIFSHDYKILPAYFEYAEYAINKYCKIHNYNYIIRNHYPNKKISPYWLRAFDLIELSNIYNDNYIFIYLDLDTIINLKYKNIKIENLLDTIDKYHNKNYDIYIGKDSPVNNYVNSGVIFIRNTHYSKMLLNEWIKQYNPNIWSLTNNKWICKKNNKICDWAGYDYEQGILEHIYTNNLFDSKNHIKILHPSICSENNLKNDAFIYHFMAYDNIIKTKYMKQIHDINVYK